MNTAKKPTPQQIQQTLDSEFYGTSQYYLYGIMGIKFHYTDGISFLAEACGAYWMLDVVASYQVHDDVAGQSFQVYDFTRDGEGLKLKITDGNNNLLATQDIEYSDFPLEKITIWYTNNVALLPSEY